MKLLRWGPKGAEKPGALDAQGKIRDLSGAISDLTPETVSLENLSRLKDLNLSALPSARTRRAP